jgi:mRNA-degrading endonuclease RelE of RelBE toxin-antitoxin system
MPGRKNVELAKSAAKDAGAIPVPYREAVKHALADLAENPFLGIPLKGSLKGLYRLRVAKYRIVYFFDDTTLWGVSVRHRKDVYR